MKTREKIIGLYKQFQQAEFANFDDAIDHILKGMIDSEDENPYKKANDNFNLILKGAFKEYFTDELVEDI